MEEEQERETDFMDYFIIGVVVIFIILLIFGK